MIQFIIAGAAGNLITDRTFGHVQPVCSFSPNGIPLHPDELDPANTRVLPGVLGKSFCLSEVVYSGRIMRFQNIYDIIWPVTADNKEVRVGRFDHPSISYGMQSAQVPLEGLRSQHTKSSCCSSSSTTFRSQPFRLISAVPESSTYR